MQMQVWETLFFLLLCHGWIFRKILAGVTHHIIPSTQSIGRLWVWISNRGICIYTFDSHSIDICPHWLIRSASKDGRCRDESNWTYAPVARRYSHQWYHRSRASIRRFFSTTGKWSAKGLCIYCDPIEVYCSCYFDWCKCSSNLLSMPKLIILV